MNEADLLLFCIMLMVLAVVMMYIGMKDVLFGRKPEQPSNSITLDKEKIDFLTKRFGSLLDEMAADNERGTILKCHVIRLQEIVKEQESKRNELETSNRSMSEINGELKRSNAELIRKAAQLHDEIRQGETACQQMEDYLDSLKKAKEGLEIAVNNIPAEEVHYLATPIFGMGMTPSVRSRLESQGILYVGDLIRVSEEYLMEVWGIGPATLEKMKTTLNENGVCFGMDVIRIDNHWYRRKTN